MNALDDGIQCSVAVGAAFGSGEYRISELLKLADRHMYAEKRRMKDVKP